MSLARIQALTGRRRVARPTNLSNDAASLPQIVQRDDE
jgi:hypothetical protein